MEKASKQTHKILKAYWARKQSKSRGYSLRALARDTGMSASYMSQIMSGKRALTSDLFYKMTDILEMDEMAKQKLSLSLFLNSKIPSESKDKLNQIMQSSPGLQEYEEYAEADLKDFDVIRNWYYVAILDLVSLKDFKPETSWVAEKLNISHYQAQTALTHLFLHGLLKAENGRWVKQKFKLRFSTNSSVQAVRSFHKSMIEKSIVELTSNVDQESFSKRLITGVCVATNTAQLEKAKDKINELMFEVSKILSEGECDEVYQLNTQLFSLTNHSENHAGKNKK